jgi:hypothetical protein
MTATRGAHFHALLRTRAAAYSLVLGIAGLFLLGGPLACALAVLGACLYLAARRAEVDFFTGFARSLGLRYRRVGRLPELLPLLAAGDRREAENVLEGEVGGLALTLAHYRFEVRRRAGESEVTADTRRFTVCVAPIAAPPGLDPGVFVRARRGVMERLAGGDWLHGARAVELESFAFSEHYELRAAAGVDEVALRQLFAPSFEAWIAEHPLAPGFEYQAGVLCVYVEHELGDEGNLTFFLDAARRIAERFSARAIGAGDC